MKTIAITPWMKEDEIFFRTSETLYVCKTDVKKLFNLENAKQIRFHFFKTQTKHSYKAQPLTLTNPYEYTAQNDKRWNGARINNKNILLPWRLTQWLRKNIPHKTIYVECELELPD